MSSTTHPVTGRLEPLVGGDARLLATVMGLPLVDGIFPALVLAGALDGPLAIVQVGLLVFGGSATVAVVLAEMNGNRAEVLPTVAVVGIGLVALAALEAALAPTIESVLDIAAFEHAAALVVLAVAARTASARVGDYLPRPAVVVGLGLLVSLDLSDPRLAFVPDPGLVLAATAAAAVGATFALAVAAAGPHLRRRMDVDRFRFGSAVALGLLALSILGLDVGSAPLAVVAVAALFALEPGHDCDHDATALDAVECAD
ncbi:DUF5794 domain-containing protein [Haloarchaeobius sp. HRN-SO-5]|uniref:DUF5794 domain-containing protein n=1 Tax=Haloarchaeobius sp. HRN-SO-5 TaxID=3446118 RepID=UPI003EB88A64